MLTLILLISLMARAAFQDPISSERLILPQDTKFTVSQKEISDRTPVALPKPKNPFINATRIFEEPRFDLSGLNRQQILIFSRQARAQKIPSREWKPQNRADLVIKKYSEALNPSPHKQIKTMLNLQIQKTKEVHLPKREKFFSWQLRRFEALFLMLEDEELAAASELWSLGRLKEEQSSTRARDYLFAGIATLRADLPFASSYLWTLAQEQEIEMQPYYHEIFWQHLSQSPTIVQKKVLAQTRGETWTSLRPRKAWLSLYEYMAKRGLVKPEMKALLQTHHIITDKMLLSLAEETQNESILDSLTESLDKDLANQAHLQLARMSAKNKSWKKALGHYQAIRDRDHNRLDLFLEQARAELKMGNYRKSLGRTLALQSDFFRYAYAPEVHLVEAEARMQLCDFGRAEQSIRNLEVHYSKELQGLEEFLMLKGSPDTYYQTLKNIDVPAAPRYIRRLAQLPEFQESQALIHHRWKEKFEIATKMAFKRSSPSWGEFLEALEQDRIKEKEFRIDLVSILLRGEAKYLYERLRWLLDQSQLMILDIAGRASDEIHRQSALNFPVREPATAKPIDDNRQQDWGYKQEIWEDELEAIEFKRPSRCAKDQLAQNLPIPSEPAIEKR